VRCQRTKSFSIKTARDEPDFIFENILYQLNRNVVHGCKDGYSWSLVNSKIIFTYEVNLYIETHSPKFNSLSNLHFEFIELILNLHTCISISQDALHLSHGDTI